MKVIGNRFVVESETGTVRTGKTLTIRDSMTGHSYVLDQYPVHMRHMKGAASWAVSEQYGDFIGKFRTQKSALMHLKKLKKVM